MFRTSYRKGPGHVRAWCRSGAAIYIATCIADQLYRTEPGDPIVFVAVPLVVVLITLATVGSVARLATRTDPARHLRSE